MEKVQVSLPQTVIVNTRRELVKLEGQLNSCERKPKVAVLCLGKQPDYLDSKIVGIIHHVTQTPDDKYLKRMKKKFDIPLE